jgi:hypothetical protein
VASIPNETLSFAGTLNEDDVAEIARHETTIRLLQYRRGSLAILVLLVMGALAFALDAKPAFLFAPFLAALFWLLCSKLFPWIRSRRARRFYRTHRSEYLETGVWLTTDRVVVANEEFRSDLSWRYVAGVCSTREGLLFCDTHWNTMFWLPNRVFGPGRTREDVLVLVRQNSKAVLQL